VRVPSAARAGVGRVKLVGDVDKGGQGVFGIIMGVLAGEFGGDA